MKRTELYDLRTRAPLVPELTGDPILTGDSDDPAPRIGTDHRLVADNE